MSSFTMPSANEKVEGVFDGCVPDEFDGYFEAKEPGMRERADAWATGIGLQAVDGLKPSQFLIETA